MDTSREEGTARADVLLVADVRRNVNEHRPLPSEQPDLLAVSYAADEVTIGHEQRIHYALQPRPVTNTPPIRGRAHSASASSDCWANRRDAIAQ